VGSREGERGLSPSFFIFQTKHVQRTSPPADGIKFAILDARLRGIKNASGFR